MKIDDNLVKKDSKLILFINRISSREDIQQFKEKEKERRGNRR